MLQKILSVIVVCTLADGFSATGQTFAPDREVQANVIVSHHDPAIRIEVPKSARYVGGDRWILYGNADCELQAFVEADPEQNVQRLYWVQFEGYLPSKPDFHHTYDSPKHTEIGGLDFYVDTWPRPQATAIDPGSDREHIEAVIRSKGYKMPGEMMYVRFVHLLDEQKRKELMIIYGEDLAPSGLGAADVQEGGKAHDRWPALSTVLVERGKANITLQPATKP